MAASSNIFHVAAGPLKSFDAELVKKAAVVIGKDPYTTRLLLAGKIPKIIATCQSSEEAESAVRGLCDLGLVAFVCSDEELRKPFTSNTRARTLKLGKAEVSFVTTCGETKTLESNDVFLILKGTRQTGSGKETTTTSRKLNVTATLLTGMPMFKKVKEKTVEEFQPEGFVRIYNRSSSDPLLEIPQNGFDYSFLGDSLAPTSHQNLDKTAETLREIFPGAVFDETLAGHADLTEADCRLVYLYHRARVSA